MKYIVIYQIQIKAQLVKIGAFEQWKKEAKDKVNKMKKDKFANNEVYKWLVENK